MIKHCVSERNIRRTCGVESDIRLMLRVSTVGKLGRMSLQLRLKLGSALVGSEEKFVHVETCASK